jgi:hypothetical protein
MRKTFALLRFLPNLKKAALEVLRFQKLYSSGSCENCRKSTNFVRAPTVRGFFVIIREIK